TYRSALSLHAALPILCRSGLTLLVLIGILCWQRQRLQLPGGTRGWQLLLGLLIATQSLTLYSAVARIPVALALLVANVFPILLRSEEHTSELQSRENL